MKIWNKCICLTSRKTLMVIATLLISTILIAGVLYVPENIEPPVELPIEQPEQPDTSYTAEVWIPTAEDILYQDSMYTIIQNTQNDITEIKQDIVYIIERLDYPDGSHDSIRYVKGSTIDKRRN